MTETPFFIPIDESKATPSLQGTTLIIPAVSIGSVPQLAVDLLLHHAELKLVKVGRLDPSFCFPFVGPCDTCSDQKDLTTALEVFSNGSLTVIQQRSPVYKSHEITYISRLLSWISSFNFSETLWLTSIDAAARTDAEFSTPLLSLFPPNSSPPSTPLLKSLLTSFPLFNPPSDPQESHKNTYHVPYIPASLLTRNLFHHAKNTNIAALLYFAAEGDTRQDAHILSNLTLHLLSSSSSSSSSSTTLQTQKHFEGWNTPLLKEPPSWAALFGRPPTASLYA
ncbi:related to ADD66 - protein involved in 20S proteasome assembly [Ustilago trichophora]|uniref:Proteasome assembly chaperone 2 n=1 Tax=Ustilago trichophora TaxID=86804 RepID=A0A5C3EHD0_9BASI|nr:related to ADD66 - protein involved in 20S proteasome assembly [Ustilago trichophora]